MDEWTRFVETHPGTDAIIRVLNRRSVRGRKVLQKLIYFLQEAEREPLGFDYRMYYYGPYSATLDARLQTLSAVGLLSAPPDSEGIATFSPTSESTALIQPDPAVDQKIDRLLSNVGGILPNDVELLATVHFLAKESAKRGPFDEGKIARQVRAWKGEKFSRAEIDSAISRLRGWGYLD